MGYLDYSYRISAAADFAASRAVPTNMANTGQALSSAGSMTLVDLGGGVRAWRFSGGAASGPTPSKALAVTSGNPAGGGVTMVIRYALTTYPAADDDRIFWWHASADALNGVGLRKFSAAGSYSCYRASNTIYGPSNGEGSAMRTLVIKLVGNESSGTADEQVKTWINTVSRSGTAPNFVGGNPIVGFNGVYDTLKLLPTGVGVADVRDIILYAGEKTDAECAALADGLDAAMTAPDTTLPTLSGAVTISGITTSGATATWPAGADNVAVASYETSLDGTAWTDRGNVLTYAFSGLTASTSYTAYVRAKDAAGNVSTPAITGTFTTSAAPATDITMTGPSGGQVGVASAAFTVGANGTISGSHTVTPSDGGVGGTFSPTTVTISAGTPTATFTYTPSTAGARTISATDAGGYTAPATISYTASATAGTFTSEPLKNNTGTVLASKALTYFRLYDPTTGNLVVSKAGLSTNGSGIVSFSDGALVAGTTYKADWLVAGTGERRMPSKAAA
jgi:hypothetical protein